MISRIAYILVCILSVALSCRPNPFCDADLSSLLDSTLLDKIVGGTYADEGQYPWLVYISDGHILCAGSIINERWILTAAHCQMKLEFLFVFCGTNDLFLSNTNVRKVKVDKFIRVNFYFYSLQEQRKVICNF